MLSIKNSISNLRYRERERIHVPNNTTNTRPSPPNVSNFYTSGTTRHAMPRPQPPLFPSRTTTTTRTPPADRLRNIEISLTEPFNSNIFGFLNNLEPTNDNITIDLLLQNTELVIYNEELNINNTCSICRLDYNNNDILRKINHCDHYFHHNCIDNWLKNHTTCPVCRHSLRATNETNEQ